MESPRSNSKLDYIHPEHMAAERAQKVEKALAELEAAGYKFKYEEAPNEFRVTLDVDGKERTIHFTKVDKFFTANDRDDDFDQIIIKAARPRPPSCVRTTNCSTLSKHWINKSIRLIAIC